MRNITYAEAMSEIIRELLVSDERTCLIGGYFAGVRGKPELFSSIRREFSSRVYDPPISELGFCGVAIGSAMTGLRPIVDVSTASFVFQAWPQLINEAANAHYMTGGKTRVPIIFHILHGIRGGGAPQHSHSPQAMFWNTPGLQIILPSSPKDVKGLLRAAVKTENPTIFVDHVKLHEMVGDVPDLESAIPLGVADVKRNGESVTIVATSFIVHRALRAAEELARQGIEAEVIDPRTLVPFDKKTILRSVEKTKHLVIADETHLSCGVASEIAAMIADEGFDYLEAPIKRVAVPDVPIPYSRPLEAYVEPTEEKIVSTVLDLLK